MLLLGMLVVAVALGTLGSSSSSSSLGLLRVPVLLPPSSSSSRSSCQPISIAMCQGIGYNRTRLPNLLGHGDQGEAGLQLQEFAPLVAYGCDPRLRFFLCSLFAPMCTEEVPRGIPACRPMCEAARARCAPVMAHFHFAWPPALDCARLPTRQDPQALCMEDPEEDPDGRASSSSAAVAPRMRGRGMLPVGAGSWGTPTAWSSSAPPPPPSGPCARGPRSLLVWRRGSCLSRCGPGVDVLWSRRDKDFALAWMCCWASLCFASTAFTVLTFLLDPGRFRYPERPIIFLSLCYNLYALAFLLRGLAGEDRIACRPQDEEDREEDDREEPVPSRSFLSPSGLESPGCTVVFVLLYYFGMASALWWVVLSLAWFLAAGKKWGHEAIEARSGYFHLLAWGVPALQALAALALRKVAGEELTGLCFVEADAGGAALTGFVLLPLAGYLAAGTSFLLRGFAALVRIRRVLLLRSPDAAAGAGSGPGSGSTHKLERLMLRLGLFSLLYTVPAACVIACYAYERLNLPLWKESALRRTCTPLPSASGGTEAGDGPRGGERLDCSLAASVPAPAVFMLKIFMSLAVGITSGAWVWSSKTLQSWQGLLCRQRRRGAPRKKRKRRRGTPTPKDPQGPPSASPTSGGGCCCCPGPPHCQHKAAPAPLLHLPHPHHHSHPHHPHLQGATHL